MMDIMTGTVEPHLFSDFFAALYQSDLSSKISQILFGFEGGVVAQPLKKPTQDSRHIRTKDFILVAVILVSTHLVSTHLVLTHLVLNHAVLITPLSLLQLTL